MKLELLFCLGLSCSGMATNAQTIDGVRDSVFLSDYTNAVGLNARLYNGPEYHDYSNGVKDGIPYFNSKDYKTGSIVFDSIIYTNVQLRLDVIYEYLTILHPPSYISIQLPNKLVQSFVIDGHQFKHLVPDSSLTLKEGFYEQLYRGRSVVYEHHRKNLQDKNKADDIYRTAVPSNSYHILSNGQWYSVRSSKALVAVFKGKEKLVQQHLRKNKLRFKKNPELAMIEAATFYDALTN